MEEIQEDLVEEEAIEATGVPRFMPAELPKGVYEYKVEKFLGKEQVSFIQNGKIVTGEPKRWEISDEYGTKILSEWSFSSKVKIPKLTGKKIRLTVNGSKKAMLEVL